MNDDSQMREMAIGSASLSSAADACSAQVFQTASALNSATPEQPRRAVGHGVPELLCGYSGPYVEKEVLIAPRKASARKRGYTRDA